MMRVPGAAQHEMVHRRPGTFRNPESAKIPDLQRNASVAPRPGYARSARA
jgi:hypothetical protein